MRYLGFIAVFLAWAQISGLDLFVAQMCAWAEMIQDRQEQGIEVAVRSTFSGEEPCERCLAIAQERQERDQEENPAEESFKKVELPLPRSREAVALTEKILPAPNTVMAFIPWCERSSELELPPPEGDLLS